MSREEVPSNPGLTECLIELEGPRGKTYDAFNLGDSRVDVPLDPIPVFMTMRLDRALPFSERYAGKGSVQCRRALDTSVFTGP